MKVFLIFLLFGQAVAAYAITPAKVIRVVDGDTLKVEMNGRIENVRLIGIDAPESKVNKKAKKNATRSSQDIKTIVSLGKAAVSFTKSIVNPGA